MESGPGTRGPSRAAPIVSLLSGIAFLLVPKCPLCFAAYAGLLAALGLETSELAWLRLGLAAALLASAGFLAYRAFRMRWFVQSALVLAGAGLILASLVTSVPVLVRIAGAILLAAGSLRSFLPVTYRVS